MLTASDTCIPLTSCCQIALPCLALLCGSSFLAHTGSALVSDLTHRTLSVRSRTTQELHDGITCVEARTKEARLFAEHPELQHVAPELKGAPALSQKLVQIQAERIQSHLPELQKQVTSIQPYLHSKAGAYICMATHATSLYSPHACVTPRHLHTL